MVREKGDSLPVESLRRLGANVVRCTCERLFNAAQKPSYSVMLFRDGEIVDSDDSWLCSSECAKAAAVDRNKTAASNEQHVDWTDE